MAYDITTATVCSDNCRYEVDEQGGERAFVSQPALSNTIHDLEEELQIEIFLRTNRGIVVTTEGEEFLSYARQMVELQQMMEEKYMGAAEHKRKFSVSMQHYSFAVEAFMKLAREFALEDFELAVHETKTSEVIENVQITEVSWAYFI